jgi:DNA-binding transcriptional LysR family regulator
LFERRTRKLSLTDQGRRLLPVAQRIVHDVDDAISSISGNTNDLEGPRRTPTYQSAHHSERFFSRECSRVFNKLTRTSR